MKLQGMGIVFILIVIPIILVLTYYIQLQVDTIELQNKYDSKLLSATRDAMSSFEINTANEDLSSVSDSLRTIIEASSNVFINTLATNLGLSNASKSYIEPYIPALLYTLYDGYYIYSPTKVPVVLTDPGDGTAVYVGKSDVAKVGTHLYSYNKGSNASVKYDDLKIDGTVTDYGQLLYESKSNAGQYTTDIEDAKYETKNVLKSYMPYSARYKDGNAFDIVVTYSLDNFITINGTIGNVYYSKSGYLLPKGNTSNSVECITVKATDNSVNILNYNQNTAQEYIEAGNNVEVTIIDEKTHENIIISSEGYNYKNEKENLTILTSYLNKAQEYKIKIQKGITINQAELNQFFANIITVYNGNDINVAISKLQEEINVIQYKLDLISSVVYYTKAKIFSDWVYNNLTNVKEKNLIEISGQTYSSINGAEEVNYVFENSDKKIFDVTGSTKEGNVEIDKDSNFYTHKLNVIRNSIQRNLNNAMSTYNNISASTTNYSMPVILNDEWSKILSNVSIVSFMQGYKCKLKTYNNYKIVSSTNNEISITPSQIYYVPKMEFSNELSEYHKIDCPKLFSIDSSTTDLQYISFTSKEVKYDKIYDKKNTFVPYTYNHKNLACYECINDGNYNAEPVFSADSSYKNLRKAYYIAIGKSRNNMYKMNAVSDSQGYEIIYNFPDINSQTSLTIGDVKSIEIVVGTLKSRDSSESIFNFEVLFKGVKIGKDRYSIVSGSTQNYTITIAIKDLPSGITSTDSFKIDDFKFRNLNENSRIWSGSIANITYPINIDQNTAIVKEAIKSIKVNYK